MVTGLSKSNHKKNSVTNVSLHYTDYRAMLPRCGMGDGLASHINLQGYAQCAIVMNRINSLILMQMCMITAQAAEQKWMEVMADGC